MFRTRSSGSPRRSLLFAAALLLDPADMFEEEGGWQHSAEAFVPPPRIDGPGIVMAAGDIADCSTHSAWNAVVAEFDGRLAWAGIDTYVPQSALQTASLIETQPGIVLALGDLAYPDGEPEDFRCFDRAWGAMFDRIYPVPGNHEYKTDGEGYRAYWGEKAGPNEGLYYSFDYAGWHLIALNSEIPASAGSEQAEWLEADLRAHPDGCVLAFHHRPAFSALKRGGHENALALFDILYRHGATLMLSGHNHFYERVAPLDPSGNVDPDRGIRSFVVGTGGKDRHQATPPPSPSCCGRTPLGRCGSTSERMATPGSF